MNRRDHAHKDIIWMIRKFYPQLALSAEDEKRLIQAIRWSYDHTEAWDFVCGIGESPAAMSAAQFRNTADLLLRDGMVEGFYVLFNRFFSITVLGTQLPRRGGGSRKTKRK